MRRTLFTATAAVATALVLSVVAPVTSAAAATPRDGTTQATAAASCWEIKQEVPSSTDGVYWLLTPQLTAPTQFYCDMTTSGGGWVLVGRGRDGWSWDGDAQGTPAQIAASPTGTGAFAPRKLSSSTIDALLAGGRVDQLSDGIRLRRATNAAGTSWQEVRFGLRSQQRWSWAFGGGMPITTATFDGSSYSGATTRDFGTYSTWFSAVLQRVWTNESSNNKWVRGFNYGSGVNGSTSASSYLFGKAAGYATPFTQVFLRPKVRTSDLTFAAVPDSGTAAIEATPVAESGSLAQPWGVTGVGAGGTGELATEVQAFAQIGGVMYVGGNFTTVRNQDGTTNVVQQYLAAFDASTGEWISSFRPTLDNQVRSLEALPDGRLAVGGDFTQVDGAAASGLAVLDTTSGTLDPAWTTTVESRGDTAKVSVRGLEVSGDFLYVGGLFTHVVQGPQAWASRNAGRIRLSNGASDGWNPNFNGSVADLDVDDDGSKVYFAGYMTSAKGVTVKKGVAISTAAGAPVTQPAWNPTYSSAGANYQQAVQQVADKVWLGGSQHSMFGYDRSTFALENSHITRSGGDLQAITDNGKVVYGGCHCGDWTYSGVTNYDTLAIGSTSTTWSRVDKISLLGAWDAATGEYINTFAPQWKSRGGFGVWSLEVASDGVLWAGGSLQTSVRTNGSNQFSGGFARFAPRPSKAPATPSGARVALEGTTATVSWDAGAPGLTYQILRGDRVVATATGTSVAVPDASAGDRYFVRATDGQGNISASTSVLTPTVSVTTVPAGSTWSYWFDSTTSVPEGWKGNDFDDSTWRTGTAPLGWGSSAIATSIDSLPATPRALTAYYRKSVTIDDADAFTTYRLTTRADDGVAVYVNGVEVARSGLPAGDLGERTYATSAPTTSAAVASPVVVDLPASAFVDGRNVVTVEVHSNYRSTPTTSFDAEIVGSR